MRRLELWETFQGICILTVSGLLTVCIFAFIYMRCGEMCCPFLFKKTGVQTVKDKAAFEKRNKELKDWQDKQRDPAVEKMFGGKKKKDAEFDMYPPPEMYPPEMYPPEMMGMPPYPDMMMMGPPPPPFMPPPPMMPPPPKK